MVYKMKKIVVKNPIFINPFFAYVLFWTLALFLYNFSPSELSIALDKTLVVFLLCTILFAFIGMLYFNSKYKNKKIYVHHKAPNAITIILLYILYLFDFIYSKNIPLLTALFGSGYNSGYYEFGIPTIHVAITIISTFYCIFQWFQFIVFRKKSNLIAFLLIALYFVLIFSRGLWMFIGAAAVILFLMDKKITVLRGICFFIFIVVAAWGFGILGNIRSGYHWNDTGYFMSVAQIDGNRYSIFSPLYWVVEYITSPLRNLNYNVSLEHEWSFSGLIYSNLPDAIAKRLFPQIDFSELVQLVLPNFTTCTGYAGSYVSFGYIGMIVSFSGWMVIALIFTKFRICRFEIKVLCFSMLFYLYAMTMFDNMIFYSGYSFSIIIALIYSFLSKTKRATRPTNYKVCKKSA